MAMRPRDLILPALLAALTGILSFVSIPIPLSPVPVTGQSLGVMLAGVLLTPRQAGLAMAAFLLLGIAGAPVFSGGTAGLGVLAGPTGGYLLGFILGAIVIALLRGKKGLPRLIAAVIIGGLLAVYIPGVLWLSRVTGLGIKGAIAAGVLPYLPGDFVKATAAIATGARLRSLREWPDMPLGD